MADLDEDGAWEEDGMDADEDTEEPNRDESMDDEVEGEDHQAVQEECIEKFSTIDYIMEPTIFSQLKRYFKAGGAPELVIRLLSSNYEAVAQMVNLLAEWLIQAGVDIKTVQEIVENHLKEMIIKNFDSKKADSIFSSAGETPSWLAEMVEYPTWRNLFYRLAEAHPDCLMLNFTVKLISDAGYQGEITSVSTACHQIEVFSRVLRTYITSFMEGGQDSLDKTFGEFSKMVCHGEHTYLYCQLLLHSIAQENKGGASIRRLSQEVQRKAQERALDVTPITLALSGAVAFPRACQALSAMLSRNALNPADISVLYNLYISANPPPVEMIRTPQFLDLFIDALFKPNVKVNPEHKSKYIYLLAYASCVLETWKKGHKKSINKDDLKATIQAIEKGHTLCGENKGSSELVADVNALFQCLKFPVVAVGILKWVECTVLEPSYFKLNTDHTPFHLVLLDEIGSNHTLLHSKILTLLTNLFETIFEEMDVLVQLELKKTLLDRMVHLLSRGCVIPVVTYIRTCYEKGDTDISLIRHFITEVLDVIAPVYSPEFVQIFLPLLENDDIVGSLKNEQGHDPVSNFINHCKANY